MEQLDPVQIVVLIMVALVVVVLLIKAAVIVGAVLTVVAIAWCIMTATGTPMPVISVDTSSQPKPTVCYLPSGMTTPCDGIR